MLCPWAALVVTKKHCPKMFMFISMGYTTVILIFSTSRGTNFPSLLLPVVVLYSALHCDGDTFFSVIMISLQQVHHSHNVIAELAKIFLWFAYYKYCKHKHLCLYFRGYIGNRSAIYMPNTAPFPLYHSSNHNLSPNTVSYP